MSERRETTNAVEILHRRYVKDEPERKASVQTERVNAEVARMIHDMRTHAGLTQKELADLIDTTQSVISRLEDADYEGHSLSMLKRIATALDQNLTVQVTAKDPEAGTLPYVFQTFVRDLRRDGGLTVERLAKKVGIDADEVRAMEQVAGYCPRPRTLYRLSEWSGIPLRALAALSGAFQDVSPTLRQSAVQFAARSESFAKLSTEEKQALDEFVEVLKTEPS